MTAKEFAAAIEIKRKALGMTQIEAAQLCGASPRTWWQWEKAERQAIYATMYGVIALLKTAKKKTA